MDGLSVLQYPASELEDGLARLVVRVRDSTTTAFVSLLGQSGVRGTTWGPDGPTVTRLWGGLAITATFRLGHGCAGWFWSVRVVNTSGTDLEVDVVHTQDVALAAYGGVRTNELYVSQYLDLTPVPVEGHGPAVGVRQNMPGERAPWALIGCLGVADRWSTDALQLVRAGGLGADLPSTRLQHEHALVGLQTPAVTLSPGEELVTGFYGLVLPDHPDATSAADARHARTALSDPAARLGGSVSNAPTHSSPQPPESPAPSLFHRAPELSVVDLTPEDLDGLTTGEPWTHVERDDGTWLAGFSGHDTHVVTAAKERAVLRPHGHVMRTGRALTVDERSVATTAWMRGVFHSQVTQGHVALGSVLSLRRSYLDLFKANGLRVFVARDDDSAGSWELLGMPSAWSVSPDHCRWWYRTRDGLVEVVANAPADAHELGLTVRIVNGPAYRLLVALHVSLGGDDGAAPHPPLLDVSDRGAVMAPPPDSERARTYPGGTVELGWTEGTGTVVSRDEPLFADGETRDLPWVTLTTDPLATPGVWSLTIRPRLVADRPGPDIPEASTGPGDPDAFWAGVTQGVRLRPSDPEVGSGPELARIDAVLSWFAHDALVHYLSPRGLEQYTGGGWGTRDVSQGPVGLLVALGDDAASRDVVVRLLRAQHARGDWPQAFDFLARHRSSRVSDAHGDVVYWPLIAIGDYLSMTADATLLDHAEPMVTDQGPTTPLPLLDHLDRALDHVDRCRIPGTPLPAYGHGDWNDSLQPADPALAAALCSTWTVTLHVHALRTLAAGLEGLGSSDGGVAEVAGRARTMATQSEAALRALLLVDGVLSGYGRFDEGEIVEHLLHPRDGRTGLTYSLLPMIHAVSGDLLTADEAQHHLGLIRDHLTGPDGARLFDRPAAYHGGPMRVFQRAEASTFFGREIGIMYTHAHLRYAEALARVGDGAGLLDALAKANPIGMPERVPAARRRQSTTYYSSSDAAVADRESAAREYPRVVAGAVPLEGGWRVYSSGPGLYLRLVVECLLGVRRRGRVVEIDPVLPPGSGALVGTVRLGGRPVDVSYRVGAHGYAPTDVRVGGQRLSTTRLDNPYRRGGVAVPADELRRLLDARGARIDVEVS